MATEMIYVFTYDIGRDTLRRRVASRLERVGTRVQESVFEIRTTQRKAETLLAGLDAIREPNDSIRMYCLTEDSRSRCRAAGGAPAPERGGFWLL